MSDDRPVDPANGVPQIPGFDRFAAIGRGGFSSVYRAHQLAFGRDVAIKILDVGEVSEDARRRFERECMAVGALSSHPNIVTVHGAGSTPGGHPYIVMELMERGSLGDRVRRDGAVAADEAVRIVTQLLDAVEAAHEVGVLHRDIKPDNVLVSRYGTPQLADFGISSIPGGYETQSGSVTATMAYAAPEVIDGAKATPTSDLYSLAAMLGTLIIGRPMFSRGADETVLAYIYRILRDPPPDLVTFGASPVLAGIVSTALAKDPAGRYPSADAFREALRSVPDSTTRPDAPTSPSVVAPIIDSVPGPADPLGPTPAEYAPTSARVAAAESVEPATVRRSTVPQPVVEPDDLIDSDAIERTVVREALRRPAAPPAGSTVPRPATAATKSDAASTVVAPEPGPVGPLADRPGRRRLWIAVGSAAALVVALSVTAFAVQSGSPGKDPDGPATSSPTPVAARLVGPTTSRRCVGHSCVFTLDGPVPGGARLSWNFGDGTSLAASTVVRHRYARSGVFTAKLVTRQGARTARSTEKIEIRSFPRTVRTLAGSPGSKALRLMVGGRSSCPGGRFDLQRRTGPGWHTIRRAALTGATMRVGLPAAGSYRVRLPETDRADGFCVAASSAAVKVLPRPRSAPSTTAPEPQQDEPQQDEPQQSASTPSTGGGQKSAPYSPPPVTYAPPPIKNP